MNRLAPQPIGDERDWLKRTLRRAQGNAHLLYDGEIVFVDQLKVRLDRFDAGTYVSAKQRAWLKRIDKRLDRHGIAADPADPGAADDPVARPVDEVIR